MKAQVSKRFVYTTAIEMIQPLMEFTSLVYYLEGHARAVIFRRLFSFPEMWESAEDIF